MADLPMTPSTIAARLAAGDLKAATPAEIRTLINVEDGADVTDETNVAAAMPLVDTTTFIKGSIDATKLIRFEADGITTGTTRVLTMGDYDIDLKNVPTHGLNVKHFGATGDGTTDDTAAIQAAIDAGDQDSFPDGTIPIFFPSGRYRCNNTLTVYDHTQLIGSRGIDTGAEIWFYGGATDNCMESDPAATATEKGMFWMENIRVADKRTTPTSGSGLVLENFKNGSYIAHCFFMDFPTNQVHIRTDVGANSDRFVIFRTWFSNTATQTNSVGLLVERFTNSLAIRDCYFDHLATGSVGIQLADNIPAEGVIDIQGCSFETNSNTTGASILMGESHGLVNISNCTQTSTGTGSHVVELAEGFEGKLTLINVIGEKHNTWGADPQTLSVTGTITRDISGPIGFCNVVAQGQPLRLGLGGNATPEGAAYGNPGELYSNYSGSSGTVLYVKESGEATNTGWRALGDLLSDTTPQLGGDLDLNGNNIDFPSVANISDCKDEDDMSSNSPTMLATQQSIKAYVDGATEVYVGRFTRATTVASGTQAVTGVGFQPDLVIAFIKAGNNAIFSNGITDGTTDACTHGGNTLGNVTDFCFADQGGGATYTGRIDATNGSLDSDGFTIDWVRVGAPSVTLTGDFVALKVS